MIIRTIVSTARRLNPSVACGALFFLSCTTIAGAAPMPSSPPPSGAGADTLRVCAAANDPPYSTSDGNGFENKIAWTVAEAMGRQLQFVWTDRPAIYLVQDFLDKNLCDVVIGLDTGDDRVLTTNPYYRSGYVFITRASDNLDIHSWDDSRLRAFDHIAVGFGTPGEEMLKAIGKYDDDFNYEKSLVNFRSARNQYIQVDPARMVAEVANGNAQIASAFSPEVARYVKNSQVPLHVVLVDDNSTRSDGQKVPQWFDQSMGVRKDDKELLGELNAALGKAQPEIQAILKDEGIILLKPHS
jgi:mxaJ protein